MQTGLDAKQDLFGQCSVCGHAKTLSELPGRSEKVCFECSADLATAILLSAEINAASVGTNTNALMSELSEISNHMLERAQSCGRDIG
jgi:hypothetical protein